MPAPDVVHRLRERDRGAAHLLAQRRVDRGRGAFLDQLLVPPLHRAVALAEMHDIAVLVGEHLHLDVARVRRARARAAGGRRRTRAAPPSAPHRARRRARSACATRRMPRPPPPAAALIISGKPIGVAARPARRCSGRPARRREWSARRRRARCASPRPCRPSGGSTAGGGPTQSSPASITACAKSAFSARKP